MNIFKKIWNNIITVFYGETTTERINSAIDDVWKSSREREQVRKFIHEIDDNEEKTRIVKIIEQFGADIQKLNEEQQRLIDKVQNIKTIEIPDVSVINESIEKLNQFLNEKQKPNRTIFVYKPKSTESFDTLLKKNDLLKQFQDREIARKKKEEQHKKEVQATLDRVATLINQEDKLDEVKTLIAQIQGKINKSLKNEIERLEKFKQKLKERELQILIKRQQEEQKKREEEEKRLRDAEEKRIIEENKKREVEDKERQAKETQEKQKQTALNALLERKPDWQEFNKVLQQNGITILYHFTDRANINSIKQYGGLYSWSYCNKNGIDIPFPGGDLMSRQLDIQYHLQDYVRVSFCDNHPMMWRLQQNGRNLVLLKISIDVVFFTNSQFSDINAADSSHTHGTTLDDLKRVNFSATKQNYVSRESPIFKQHQAEVLVKTWIPIKYIANIKNF